MNRKDVLCTGVDVVGKDFEFVFDGFERGFD